MTSDLSGPLLPTLYQLDQRHWWSAGMRSIAMALLEGAWLPEGAILEAGCGAGHVVHELARRYPDRRVIGIDLHPIALSHARLSLATGDNAWFAQADLHQLPMPDAVGGLVVALDVLDQEGIAPAGALAEVRRVLREEGLLLLRVSAHRWLESPHDAAFGTARRYTAAELRHFLAQAGFAVLRLTHANALLLPPAIAVRQAERLGWLSTTSELVTPGGLNGPLRQVLGAEARWLRRRDLPAGLSLYALARKSVDR